MICMYILLCVFFVLGMFFFFKRKGKKQSCCIPPKLTDWDIKFMAYHEAGHAVCSYFLPERERLIMITIDPSSEAFGMVRTESRPHHNETRTSFSSMISTLLAGRIAEEMFLKTQTTSCIHDIAYVQEIASDMVVKFGMGKTTGLSILNRTDNTCERYAEQVCTDIRQIIQEAESDARMILQQKHAIVIALAEKLRKDKSLHADEIARFFEQQNEKI